MLTFPHALMREAVTDRPRLVGAARLAGRAASGIVTMSRTDGGGLWAYGLQAIAINTREQVLLWEMFTTQMHEGATPIIVPICNGRYSPRPIIGGTRSYSTPPVPHSDETPFSDQSAYDQYMVTAHVSTPALLRSTELWIFITSGGSLVGGEMFSIDHPTRGTRWYRIVGMVQNPPGSSQYVCTIEPPLRQAVAVNTPINFDEPRCVMQLAEPTGLQLQMRRHGRPSLNFIESFLPLT